MQSVNKRYSICQKPTPRKTFAKRFSQDIFPSSVGIGCKGTTKFADVQEKSHQNAIFMVESVRAPHKVTNFVGDPACVWCKGGKNTRRINAEHRTDMWS